MSPGKIRQEEEEEEELASDTSSETRYRRWVDLKCGRQMPQIQRVAPQYMLGTRPPERDREKDEAVVDAKLKSFARGNLKSFEKHPVRPPNLRSILQPSCR